MNLYRNDEHGQAEDQIRGLTAPFHTFSEGRFSTGMDGSSSAAAAEKLRALKPSFMAWNNVPTPRKMGSLKILYCSERRGSGICSVTISPDGLRTATQ